MAVRAGGIFGQMGHRVTHCKMPAVSARFISVCAISLNVTGIASPVRSRNGGNAEDNGEGTKPEHYRAKPGPVSRFLISLKPLHRRRVDDFGDLPALQLGFKSHEDNRMPSE
jgi:hypothetical protein